MWLNRLASFTTFLLFLCLFFSTLAVDDEDAEELGKRSSETEKLKNAKETSEDEEAITRLKEAFGKIKKLVGAGIKMAMPYLMSSMSRDDIQVSQDCKRAMFLWIADLKSVKPWALRIADASAKVIDGVLTGTLSSFGSYDQCLDTVNPKGTIRGQYCSVESWPKMPSKPRFYSLNQRLPAFKKFENDTGMMGEFTKSIQLFYMFPLRLGVCIPSACTASDLSNLTSLVSENLISMKITVPRCEVREPAKIELYQIPILVVIAILTTLVICGTLYDLLVFKKKNHDGRGEMGILSDCLMCFSATSNWNKLMDLETGKEDLSVLHGIRFFSMCWIILGHTYFHLNFNILRHLQITIEMTSRFIFNSVTNATLVVDNFFLLSGLLYVYVTMDMMKVMGKLPRCMFFILHRFWRFLPIQMFFVGFTTLLPLFGDGPVWHENIDPIVKGCRADWWANMIFINNFFRSTQQGCLSYSWYLAADFQIYIFCMPIVLLVIRKPRVGLWVNFVVMILSVVAVAVHNYVRDLPPGMLFTRADTQQRSELMRETYYNPYQHIGPFCIGVFVGYFLQVRTSPIKMHWSLHWAAWLTSVTLTSAALFGVHPWNRGYGATGAIPTMLYASLGRMAWTLGMAWITVACTKGCGGFLAWILRSKVYVPFSRLTFLVYMVHPLVQHVFYSTLRGGIQAMNHLAVFMCFGFIISSYGIALILSLLLESPFINLGKVIFQRRESAKKRRGTGGEATDLAFKSRPTDWKSGVIPPPLTNGYGKSNSAYEYQAEGEDHSKKDSYTNHDGDFICHL